MATAERMRLYRAKLRAECPPLDGRTRAARIITGRSLNCNARLLAAMREASRLSKARARGALHLLNKPARAYRRQSAQCSPLESNPEPAE